MQGLGPNYFVCRDPQPSDALSVCAIGGHARNRTGVRGFAVRPLFNRLNHLTSRYEGGVWTFLIVVGLALFGIVVWMVL